MSTDQIERIIELVTEKSKNVFLTGPGGCGKTYAIKELVKVLEERRITHACTGTTGVAAVGISGRTLHSFAGIGLGHGKPAVLYKNLKPGAKKLWRNTRVLIIDEISMLGTKLLEKLDYIARRARDNEQEPFGGMIVVGSGDFLQLSPINENYAFTSPIWDEMNFCIVKFDQPYRFLQDKRYFRMLQRIRYNEPTKNDILRISYRDPDEYEIGYDDLEIKPTQLFATNKEVKQVNEAKLAKLKSKPQIFACRDSLSYMRSTKDNNGEESERFVKITDIKPEEIQEILDLGLDLNVKKYDKFLENLAPDQVIMKVDAQVMLTVNENVDLGLINGSRGVVRKVTRDQVEVEFTNGHVLPIKRFKFSQRIKGRLWVIREQIPLILAWAGSIHKSQGQTLDRAEIDARSIFAPSQVYVALSRVRTLNGLYIRNFDRKLIKVDRKALEYTKAIENDQDPHDDEFIPDE